MLKQISIFWLLFFVLMGITAICDAQDLVLHLSFDELNAKVAKDLSEFGNDATFKGSARN